MTPLLGSLIGLAIWLARAEQYRRQARSYQQQGILLLPV